MLHLTFYEGVDTVNETERIFAKQTMKTILISLSLVAWCLATAEAQPSSDAPTAPSRETAPTAKGNRLVAIVSKEEKGATRLMAIAGTKTGRKEAQTFSSFDRPDARSAESFPKGAIKFEQIDAVQVLKFYQELSGRTVVYPSTLPAAKISLQNETPLTRVEILQALDTALAQNGITMVLMGTKFVKAVPSSQAPTEAGPVIELPPDQLPESSSYLTYIVPLKHRDATQIVPALQSLASKMPNSIMAIKDPSILILRDYSANIRRMLQVVEQMDQKPQTDERKR